MEMNLNNLNKMEEHFNNKEKEEEEECNGLYKVLKICVKTGNYFKLNEKIYEVFSSINLLSTEFLPAAAKPNIDQDIHDCRVSVSTSSIDFVAVQRTFRILEELNTNEFIEYLMKALIELSNSIGEFAMGTTDTTITIEKVIISILIVFELPFLREKQFLEIVLPKICFAIASLDVEFKRKLTTAWAAYRCERLETSLESLHQVINNEIMTLEFLNAYDRDSMMSVCNPVLIVINVIYYASILAVNPNLTVGEPENEIWSNHVGRELGIEAMDFPKPLIPLNKFYNQSASNFVNQNIEVEYVLSQSLDHISFLNHPIILTPFVKARALYEFNKDKYLSVHNEILCLTVNRSTILEDTFDELIDVLTENPKYFLNQLVVHFENEAGIDHGGLSREYFQLVVTEILKPEFRLFTLQNDSQTYWFSQNCLPDECKLIGIIFGLAVYNRVLMPINFPRIFYKYCLGNKKHSLDDLADLSPSLFISFISMLNYEESNFSEVFLQTFRINFQNSFGTIVYHDLKEDGDNILVTHENKSEFVNLYADFLLHKSIEQQLQSFQQGFHMIIEKRHLRFLFLPEELEICMCGIREYDFYALENSTTYDGYSTETPVIKFFWSVFHYLPLVEKQKFLLFLTGSDRIPIGGIGTLGMKIYRNGSDTDNLPTSHTCFNVLLLPEYSSKEKLRDKILKAINYNLEFGLM